MSFNEVKPLLKALLWEIYGKPREQSKMRSRRTKAARDRRKESETIAVWHYTHNPAAMDQLSISKLIDISSIIQIEIRLMSYFLERLLIYRERGRRYQDALCEFVSALLYLFSENNAHPPMRFSLIAPPGKVGPTVIVSPTNHHTVRYNNNNTYNKMSSTNTTSTTASTSTSTTTRTTTTITKTISNDIYGSNLSLQNCSAAINTNNTNTNTNSNSNSNTNSKTITNTNTTNSKTKTKTTSNNQADGRSASTAAEDEDAASDYNQWLHAMKLVARLPGGMPPEFRRKLWLSLADKYLKLHKVDWATEEEKCFCEKWREDDEELGIQIVKDLHRTGSNLCTGPAGSVNQAKLKRILLGYARYNPEVGYCQGFNMLGALILQVMEKEESESMKVMIYLVEGVLPTGYFYGSMGVLQADMGVFRELMQSKLPRLAKHLQKLQGPLENAYEPPLTNVFTMQWFLTMFCTCLPMTCVLRVWDLVLIEGSDVLLRTALVLWSLLEERVLRTRSADDFYCKMGSFSSELLNGHLIDSNGLIEKIVLLGPISDIQKLRDKHLYNVAPLRHNQGLQLYFDEEEVGSDEESRLAVATVWGIPWGRRGSQGTAPAAKQVTENKDRIALDISLLKKQYDRLRERQKQAHIILTAACSASARQPPTSQQLAFPVNQLLQGRPAIVTNRGRRIGPPSGVIPPARKPSLPAILQVHQPERKLRRGETLHWRDTDPSKRRRESLTWKEIKADRAILKREGSEGVKSHKLASRLGKSDSSSYSEESDGEPDAEENGSSTDTSLCDDDDPTSTTEKTHSSSQEGSPRRTSKSRHRQKDPANKLLCLKSSRESSQERQRPKSWAPSTNEIPFMLMTSDSPVHSGDGKVLRQQTELRCDDFIKEEEDSTTESDRIGYDAVAEVTWTAPSYSSIAGDLASSNFAALHLTTNVTGLTDISDSGQISPPPDDITSFLQSSAINPLPTAKQLFLDSTNSLGSGDGDDAKKFNVNDDGVTNQYFERVNSVEKPTTLDLFYSLNEEESIRKAFDDEEYPDGHGAIVLDDIDLDGPSSDEDLACDEEAKNNLDYLTVESENCVVEEAKQPDSNRRLELLLNYSDNSTIGFKAAELCELPITSESEEQSLVGKYHYCDQRDNDIPGENVNDLKDDKVVKSSPTHQRKGPTTLSMKRRDPRRLTLTRSTTIEVEDRSQALEKELSVELPRSEIADIQEDSAVSPERTEGFKSFKDYSTKMIAVDRICNLNQSFLTRSGFDNRDSIPSSDVLGEVEEVPNPRRRIPSTDELEERFSALEKDFSESKSVRNISPEGCEQTTDILPRILGRSIVKTFQKESSSDNNRRSSLDDINASTSIRTSAEGSEGSVDIAPISNKIVSVRPIAGVLRQPITSTDAESNKSKTFEKSIEVVNGEERISQTVSPMHFSESNSESLMTPNRSSKIPSTTDLEDRFEALERQMSSNKVSPKNVTDLQQTIQNDNSQPKENGKEKNGKDNANGKHNAESPETRASSSSSKRESPAGAESERPSLSKVPSTAELENRYETLERKRSFQKSISPVNKKEPPDDASPCPTEPPPTPKVTSKNQSIDLEEAMNDEEQNGVTSKDNQQTPVNTPTSPIAEEPKEVRTPPDGETPRKKPPPSTAELEKRFQALERTLSSTNMKGKESTNRVDKASPTPKPKRSPESRTESQTHSTDLDKMTHKEGNGEIGKVVPECEADNDDSSESKPTTTAIKTKSETEMMEKVVASFTSEGLKAKTNRRSSEPPTTEDLEKRYEILKRRMSSKLLSQKAANKADTVEPVATGDHSLQRIEKDTIVEDAEQSEERKLSDTTPSADTSKKSSKVTKDRQLTPPDNQNSGAGDTTVSPTKAKQPSVIPKAPPMPEHLVPDNQLDESTQSSRRALIEELQRKIKTSPNDENIKPSAVNPKRKSPIDPGRVEQRLNDETSETPAITAFYRSGNYEPWLTSNSNRMVRRFSDLPSRADLENRLQFLERQLSRKLTFKQRCASDSEVASKSKPKPFEKQLDHERPTSSKHRQSDDSTELEKRVQALEKQLSENSFKLLEAMRVRQQENTDDPNLHSPRRLSTETIDATGRELVRYTHFGGSLEETDSHKPINISINIKMLLNKDDTEVKERAEKLPTTEELQKRLEVLEQQLKTSSQASTEDKVLETKLDPNETKQNSETQNQPSTTPKPQVGTLKEPSSGEKCSATTKPIDNPEKSKESVNSPPKKDAPKTLDKNSKPQSTPSGKEIANNKKSPASDKEKKQVTAGKQPDPTVKKPSTTEASNPQPKPATSQPPKAKISPEAPKKPDQSKNEKKDPPKAVVNAAKEAPKAAPKEQKIIDQHQSKKDVPSKKTDPKIEEKQVPAENSASANASKSTKEMLPDSSTPKESVPKEKELPEKMVINTSDLGPMDPNNKTLVLLLDNEPKAVKVRRLTRANTEELEGLFQALEKQLSDRNLIKTEDGTLKHNDQVSQEPANESSAEAQAISDLSKEIQDFASSEPEQPNAEAQVEERVEEQMEEQVEAQSAEEPDVEKEDPPYDWGADPGKKHLKQKTVYLPSTRELEARFRSLERQIKLLEDVEKIDVEQRLNEIERKIKLQYSLSHEKDIAKYLELCEGKGLDDEPESSNVVDEKSTVQPQSPHRKSKTSVKEKTPHTSPVRQGRRTPHTSPSRKKSPYTSPVSARQRSDDIDLPSTEDLEYRYRALDSVKRSKSKENLCSKTRKGVESRKQPIHAIEMLLDSSPDDSHIPMTGELEHRIRVLDGKSPTSSSRRSKHRSHSPTIDDIIERKLLEGQSRKPPIHDLEAMVTSPTRRELPTEDELEARMRALEQDHKFDFKTQKNYKEFNQKLKDIITPSLSYEDFQASKSREQSPKRQRTTPTPKSMLRDTDREHSREQIRYRSTSPKVIRFREDEASHRSRSRDEFHESLERTMVGDTNAVVSIHEENSKILHRILQKTLTDAVISSSHSNSIHSGPSSAAIAEGLDEMGTRLMRETSPLTRTGTHTGVPLRTGDNINDRLTSIKNTIKSIDTLCEEKPYRKERCQRYIDSLFSDSVHFAEKKASLESLSKSRSRSGERKDPYTPSIHISDHSQQRPSEYFMSRSLGSVESMRSTSPQRSTSYLQQHRSTRDLRREVSPRRRLDEDREEYESRVRRDNMLPNYFIDNPRDLSSGSLTKFHKVDRQLDTYRSYGDDRERSSSRSSNSRSPLQFEYPYESSRDTMSLKSTHNNNNNNIYNHSSNTTSGYGNNHGRSVGLDRPVSPYRQTSHNLLTNSDPYKRTHTANYTPSKLEIRHTTVTSTFYDRFLTEKEIEKNLSKSNNKSPLVSPSVTAKSYQLDLPLTSGNFHSKTFNKNSPIATITPDAVHATGSNNSINSSSVTSISSATKSNFSWTGGAFVATNSFRSNFNRTSTTTVTTTTTTSAIPTTTTANTMATGNSSIPQLTPRSLPPMGNDISYADQHIRSCDNLLMQIKSSSTNIAGGSTGFNSSPILMPKAVPMTMPMSMPMPMSTPINSTPQSIGSNITAHAFRLPSTTTGFNVGNISTSADRAPSNQSFITTTTATTTSVSNMSYMSLYKPIPINMSSFITFVPSITNNRYYNTRSSITTNTTIHTSSITATSSSYRTTTAQRPAAEDPNSASAPSMRQPISQSHQPSYNSNTSSTGSGSTLNNNPIRK